MSADDAAEREVRDLVQVLNENVGTVVVQAMTGATDGAQPARWARADGPAPRLKTADQLRLGYRVWRLLEQEEGRDVALAWLVGANSRLGEDAHLSNT